MSGLVGYFPVGTVPVGTGQTAASDNADATESLTDGVVVSELLIGDRIQSGNAIEVLSLLDLINFDKYVYRSLGENLTLTELLESQPIAVLIENMTLSESLTRAWEGLANIHEDLNMQDFLSVFLSDQLTESVTITDLWEAFQLLIALQDLMRLSGTVDSVLETNEVLAELLAVTEVLRYVLSADISEVIDLTDLFQTSLVAVNNQLDAIQIADALAYSVTITAIVPEDMVVSDIITSTAEMLRLLEEGLVVGAKITNDTGVYEAWTMNTMTGGATLYDNFPFNSFALHTNQKYLGATPDGIYELEGSDDDGADINAGFKTGLKDFGSTLSKRMVDAWFTMTADGELLFKVTTVEDSGKVERWYKATKTPRMHRAKMARGVKAMFWQFELTNIDGRDFDLDNMALHPLPLNRRY